MGNANSETRNTMSMYYGAEREPHEETGLYNILGSEHPAFQEAHRVPIVLASVCQEVTRLESFMREQSVTCVPPLNIYQLD